MRSSSKSRNTFSTHAAAYECKLSYKVCVYLENENLHLLGQSSLPSSLRFGNEGGTNGKKRNANNRFYIYTHNGIIYNPPMGDREKAKNTAARDKPTTYSISSYGLRKQPCHLQGSSGASGASTVHSFSPVSPPHQGSGSFLSLTPSVRSDPYPWSADSTVLPPHQGSGSFLSLTPSVRSAPYPWSASSDGNTSDGMEEVL